MSKTPAVVVMLFAAMFLPLLLFYMNCNRRHVERALSSISEAAKDPFGPMFGPSDEEKADAAIEKLNAVIAAKKAKIEGDRAAYIRDVWKRNKVRLNKLEK